MRVGHAGQATRKAGHRRPRMALMRGSGGTPGQAAAHGGDGPVDDGLVVGGQPLVVADGAAAGDPGQGALDDPAAGQHLERVQVIGAPDDLKGELERGLGPGDPLA
jgi:hypothetical protein